jgi:UDP-N-acetylglucosamine--dolichyl-phosphate N-acetylglucosaminephosphotransferase
MSEYLYPIILLASFSLSYVSIRYLKERMLTFGIKGRDVNKEKRPWVPESGGMLLLPGIWILVVMLVELEFMNPLAYVFLFVVSCFAAMGFFDDGFRIFKREEGWSKYLANRAIILFLITLPFAILVLPEIINCGCSDLYRYGVISGLFILLVSSLANSFAGLNGWESGSTMVVLAGLTVMISFSEIYTSTLIGLCLIMLGAAAGFFIFNKYPARVFPGDAGTLLFGAFMGMAILFIEHWYLAVGLFFPHALDIILKVKTNPHDVSQKKEMPYELKDGKLHVPKSGKLDFAKYLLLKMGPMTEKELSSKIRRIVVNNTLFWTLFYILLQII